MRKNKKNYNKILVTFFLIIAFGTLILINKASASVPSVTSQTPTSITQTSATLWGNIRSDGGFAITARGVCYALDTGSQPIAPFGNCFIEGGTLTGEFSKSVTGLTAGTNYYYYPYAENATGTSTPPFRQFTTSAATVPTVTTNAVSSITQTTATGGGTITDSGFPSSPLTGGVCWGTTASPTACSPVTIGQQGSISESMTPLTVGTKYYYRAYATNPTGTGYGSDVVFTTTSQNVAPSVINPTSTSITSTSATLGGSIVSAGIPATITERGVCYKAGGPPITPFAKCEAEGGTSLGVFSKSVTGLTAGTSYFFYPYAKNSTVTSNLPVSQFTTSAATTGPSYEYKNFDGKQTTICGFSDQAGCGVALKNKCGNDINIALFCKENIFGGCSNSVEPVCPVVEDDVVIIDSGKEPMEGAGGWVYKNLTTEERGDVFTSKNKCEKYREDNKITTSTTNCYSVYKLLAPIGKLVEAPDNIGDYFNTIFLIAIGLCGALAVIMIVIGGVQYMGDESIFGKTEAKSKIMSAVLGLLIALGSYALLNTVNPDLLGKRGINIKAVSAEIIDLPDAGDNTVDPNFKTGNGNYTLGSTSSGVTSTVAKLQEGWTISKLTVSSANNKMTIDIEKNGITDTSSAISTAHGSNGYAEVGKGLTGDRKTPKGTWTILSMTTPGNGVPVYNATGSNMGASYWLLSAMNTGERGIGIHGSKSGTTSGATAGCIRLTNADLLALLPYIKTGLQVVVN